MWANLESLFGLTPLKRQFFVRGEICDILAVDDSRRLVVLELKNSEDRYIVQQLTRYYDNLLESKPFKEEVDYEKPVRLVAVAPNFHKHNFIDRKYTTLELEFLESEVFVSEPKFYLQLKSLDGIQISQLEIPYREIELAVGDENIPTPPQLLLGWLGSYDSERQEAILKLRKQLLSFHQYIQETIEAKSIKYGKGKKSALSFVLKGSHKKLYYFSGCISLTIKKEKLLVGCKLIPLIGLISQSSLMYRKVLARCSGDTTDFIG